MVMGVCLHRFCLNINICDTIFFLSGATVHRVALGCVVSE